MPAYEPMQEAAHDPLLPSVSPAAHGDHVAPSFYAMALGSIGIVYGDIGTSPLYAFREAASAAADSGPVTRIIVLGVLSMILWALIVVVTVKYVLILLRADNNGEGGTLALMALAQRAVGPGGRVVLLLGVISASLFYGDAVITPAISVLSAVEGLKVATPAFDPYVAPLTIAILIALFALQARGTARVAALFGPLMALWFIALAAAGLAHIVGHPGVLRAFDPAYAASFMAANGKVGWMTLGAVFLVVTGAEALYAALGHFGAGP